MNATQKALLAHTDHYLGDWPLSQTDLFEPEEAAHFGFKDETLAAPQGYPDNNPKTAIGLKKPPLGYVPSVAIAHEAMAFKDGARKYGPANWREKGVSASVYYHAALRHLASWWEGEENAEDSGAHHLGHARACLAIILDAQFANTLNDDRPPAVDFSGLLKELTEKEKPVV